MGSNYQGLSLAWGTFYQELSLGYFLPGDYPLKELSFVTFLWGIILGVLSIRDYPWGHFLFRLL